MSECRKHLRELLKGSIMTDPLDRLQLGAEASDAASRDAGREAAQRVAGGKFLTRVPRIGRGSASDQ
jgi:hypothetical protein